MHVYIIQKVNCRYNNIYTIEYSEGCGHGDDVYPLAVIDKQTFGELFKTFKN